MAQARHEVTAGRKGPRGVLEASFGGRLGRARAVMVCQTTTWQAHIRKYASRLVGGGGLKRAEKIVSHGPSRSWINLSVALEHVIS